ncbi:unnamed protein product [Fusarium graminearum]|nr:unnamed protein product [Fusarium graminearum]CAG1972064.1 unnamed protein product [Fusarium graminearum]CAG1979086.1 unnamed protein product [Fusarium graminearum]VTO91296.1 unnamed protein product [Fusarium graminearum]
MEGCDYRAGQISGRHSYRHHEYARACSRPVHRASVIKYRKINKKPASRMFTPRCHFQISNS